MPEKLYDIESQQLSVSKSKSSSSRFNTFQSQFTKLKTNVINHYKSVFISAVFVINAFIAIHHYNQMPDSQIEPEQFDDLSKSDESMRNLMASHTNPVPDDHTSTNIKVATFNFGGPNASPFEYYPSNTSTWYSTFEAINNEIHQILRQSSETVGSILSNDQRVAEFAQLAQSFPDFASQFADFPNHPIQRLMEIAYTPTNPLEKQPYESRIFAVLGRIDRYTWLKQDDEYPTGELCRQDLINDGSNWIYQDWSAKWETKWIERTNNKPKFNSAKFLEGSKLKSAVQGNKELELQFAIIMLKMFDRICWNAAVRNHGGLQTMFLSAFSGFDEQTAKVELLEAVTAAHHVTFVHEGTNLSSYDPFSNTTKYHIFSSTSLVGTPSMIIFNQELFGQFQADDQVTANEFIAVKYNNVVYASYHAPSSPKTPNTAVDKMRFIIDRFQDSKVIAGMDCNEDIFERKSDKYTGNGYPDGNKLKSMTVLKMRTDIQEQHGKGNYLDEKQKDEILYHDVNMVQGSGQVMTVDEITGILRPIGNIETERYIPNSKMSIDHFIVSAEFTI